MRSRWSAAMTGGTRPPVTAVAFTYLRYRARLLHTEGEVVVHAVGVADEDVFQRGWPVEQRLRPHPRQDERILHHLPVDLRPERFPLGRVSLDHRLVEQLVRLRHPDAEVGVAGRADGPAVHDLGEEAITVRPVRGPPVGHQAELVLLREVRLAGVQLEVVTLRVRLEGQLDA